MSNPYSFPRPATPRYDPELANAFRLCAYLTGYKRDKSGENYAQPLCYGLADLLGEGFITQEVHERAKAAIEAMLDKKAFLRAWLDENDRQAGIDADRRNNMLQTKSESEADQRRYGDTRIEWAMSLSNFYAQPTPGITP